MTRDWERLARTIRTARDERGWTQEDLARAAEVGYSTVQRLESGKASTRMPPTLGSIERALGWAAGSARAVLEGGEPTLVDTAPPAAETAPGKPSLTSGLPLRVIQELTEGEVLDTEVLDLSRPGSSSRMVVVIKKGGSDATPDEIRQDLEEWARVQRALRRIAADRNGLESDGN